MVYTSEARGFYGSTDLEPDEAAEEIARDFLVFAKLAALRGVVPPGWDWAAVLDAAPAHLLCAFEKSDAQEKYGSENVFEAMMGGRSLRYTGEVVYGFPCHTYGASDEHAEVTDAVDERRGGLYDGVGGQDGWMQLQDDLQYALESGSGGVFHGVAQTTFDAAGNPCVSGHVRLNNKKKKKRGGGKKAGAPGR